MQTRLLNLRYIQNLYFLITPHSWIDSTTLLDYVKLKEISQLPWFFMLKSKQFSVTSLKSPYFWLPLLPLPKGTWCLHLKFFSFTVVPSSLWFPAKWTFYDNETALVYSFSLKWLFQTTLKDQSCQIFFQTEEFTTEFSFHT